MRAPRARCSRPSRQPGTCGSAPAATATPAQAGLWARQPRQLQSQTSRRGRGPSGPCDPGTAGDAGMAAPATSQLAARRWCEANAHDLSPTCLLTSPPRAPPPFSPSSTLSAACTLRPSTSCHLQGIYSCGARSPPSSLATCVTSTADGPRPRGPYVAHPVLHC